MQRHRSDDRLYVGSLRRFGRRAFVGQQLRSLDHYQQRRAPRLAGRVLGDDREPTCILVHHRGDVQRVHVAERLQLVVFRHQFVVEQPLNLRQHIAQQSVTRNFRLRLLLQKMAFLSLLLH